MTARLKRERPDLDPATFDALIRGGRVFVGGAPVTNPRALVPADAALVVDDDRPLRGTTKLRAALDAFGVDVRGRVALDVGASTGGFTVALLDAGARKVYAVDAGYGQLKGSLRLDPRVVNLERTNLSALDRALVPDAVDVLVADLSYTPLAKAIPQLARVAFADGADAIVLVKPMFELALDRAPLVTDERDAAGAAAVAAHLADAIARVADALVDAGFRVVATMRSPHPGAHGAVEGFVHAVRSPA